MGANNGKERRSLKYIRLAAFLAGQPEDVERIEMSFGEIEGVVGEKLPPNARFPSWWRNDERRMHSRAWLSAGWVVIEMGGEKGRVVFVRQEGAQPSRMG
jgi:hypothetical protein